MGKVVAIIQARIGSTRLPGKVMIDICGKSVLAHDIERIKQSKTIDEIIIATTTSERDKIITKEAANCGVKYYRGSEENVLSRYYHAAKEVKTDTIVRITSDCPLIDPYVIDDLVRHYNKNEYELVTNAGSESTKRTYPRGLDTEVFSFSILEKAYRNARLKYQKEHVTPFIYENSDKIYYYKNQTDYSKYRLTLDEEADLKLIKKIYEELYNGQHDFFLDDIINLLKNKPHYLKINQHIEQKKLKGDNNE